MDDVVPVERVHRHAIREVCVTRLWHGLAPRRRGRRKAGSGPHRADRARIGSTFGAGAVRLPRAETGVPELGMSALRRGDGCERVQPSGRAVRRQKQLVRNLERRLGSGGRSRLGTKQELCSRVGDRGDERVVQAERGRAGGFGDAQSARADP